MFSILKRERERENNNNNNKSLKIKHLTRNSINRFLPKKITIFYNLSFAYHFLSARAQKNMKPKYKFYPKNLASCFYSLSDSKTKPCM